MAKEPIVWKRGVDMRDSSMHYNYKGRRYPSVTSVLGPHSDFIWVERSKIKEEVVRLNALHSAGLMDELPLWDGEVWTLQPVEPLSLLLDGDHISNAGARFMKRAADRGSVCHDMLCDYAAGARPDDSQLEEWIGSHIYGKSRACSVDDVLPYAKALLAWLDEKQPQIAVSEMPVFNDTHEYAGTMDAIAYVDGALWCMDLKTSNSFKRTWMAQIAAYSHADFGVLEDVEVPIPQDLPCAVLQVADDRWNWREVTDPRTAFTDFFLPALKAHTASKELPLPPKGLTTKL